MMTARDAWSNGRSRLRFVCTRGARCGDPVETENLWSPLLEPRAKTECSNRCELSIRVVVKDNNAWKIAAFHNTMLPR
jgi:hypothetical protein